MDIKSDFTTPEKSASLFKALSHPSRLMILHLLQGQSRHGEELAKLLNLSPATVSHHMNLLLEEQLVLAQKEQYYQVYRLNEKALDVQIKNLLMFRPSKDQSFSEKDKVLHAFFKDGKLVKFPSQLKKQRFVLEKLVEAFDFDRTYTELEVNRVLVAFHDDVATLRRSLINERLMVRQNSIYSRPGTKLQTKDPEIH